MTPADPHSLTQTTHLGGTMRITPALVALAAVAGLATIPTTTTMSDDIVPVATASRVATRAEYQRLRYGMTTTQVAALFGNGGRFVTSGPMMVRVTCEPSEIFCTDASGGGNGVVMAGPYAVRKYFTGYANKYDARPGRACYSFELTYIRDAAGVARLAGYENHSNTCYTNTNRNY